MNNISTALLFACLAFAPLPAHPASDGSTHRFVEVGDAKLYVQTFGHGAPILFLHGGMTYFDNSFAKQQDYPASYRTVIGIDQRGHGHSPDGSWSLYQGMAADSVAIIEQLGLGPLDIVGHSDGADIALLVARAVGRKVRDNCRLATAVVSR